MSRQTFALFFGNRGFMPESLVAGARKEMCEAVVKGGFDYLIMDDSLTRYGAVEGREEGEKYAKWLDSHRGEFDGVILCMPNFSDESGAVTALQDAGVPILIQAYPDEIGKMGFETRRDAFCGNFSIEDVFYQYGVKFTAMKPHVVHPLSVEFAENLQEFAAVCRVVKGMKRFTVGCIGARTTKFKTVRFDEIALQKYGITVESFDLSELIYKVGLMQDDDPKVQAKADRLREYTNCSRVPEDKMLILSKIGVILDEYICDYKLDALTLRCWDELHDILGVAPCVLLSELNDRGFVASCEIDLCSAITMYGMQLASQYPTACLDWNNNYGTEKDKVILFHCGPVAQSLMTDKGIVTDHKMFSKNNPGCGWGSNEGRICPFTMTYSNCRTENGKLLVYVSEGEFLSDPIEDAYFGCAGVAQIKDLEDKLLKLGRGGFKHHTTVGMGKMKNILEEAFGYYLGYEMVSID